MGEAEDLIQYKANWDCPKIKKFMNEDNQKVWCCGWCPDELVGSRPKPFSGWNNLKAVCHVTGSGGQSIRQCRGRVPLNYHHAYHQLYLQF
jgi:hypothetical protein